MLDLSEMESTNAIQYETKRTCRSSTLPHLQMSLLWILRSETESLVSEHGCSILTSKQRFLVSTQPIRPLSDGLPSMREFILFFNKQLRKGNVTTIGHKDGIPT